MQASSTPPISTFIIPIGLDSGAQCTCMVLQHVHGLQRLLCESYLVSGRISLSNQYNYQLLGIVSALCTLIFKVYYYWRWTNKSTHLLPVSLYTSGPSFPPSTSRSLIGCRCKSCTPIGCGRRLSPVIGWPCNQKAEQELPCNVLMMTAPAGEARRKLCTSYNVLLLQACCLTQH